MQKRLFLLSIAIIYIVCVSTYFLDTLKFYISPDPRIDRVEKEEFDFGKLSNFAEVKTEGFIFGEKGLKLSGNSRGVLYYHFTKKPHQTTTFYTRSYASGTIKGVSSKWKVSFDRGRAFQDLSTEIRQFDQQDALIDLSSLDKGKTDVTLVLESVNNDPQEVLLLNWLEVKLIDSPSIKGSTYGYPSALKMTLLLLLMFIPPLSFIPSWRKYLPVFLILLAGFYFRFDILTKMVFSALETDAIKFKQFALNLKLFSKDGFYSGKFLQYGPGYPMVSKIFHFLLGPSDTHQRLVSLFFSLSSIYLSYVLTKRLFNHKIGLLVSAMMAFNGALIFESARGNRFEFLTVLILLFVGMLLEDQRIDLKKAIKIGCLAGLLGLTAFYSILASFILIPVAFIRSKVDLKRSLLLSLLSLFIMMGLFSPHYYNLTKQNENVTKRYAKFNAQLEASGRQRLPIPIDKEIKINYNPQKDKNFSYFDYVFKMHSFKDVVFYHLEGYAKALLLQGTNLNRDIYQTFVFSRGFHNKLKILTKPLIFIFINTICIFGMLRALCLPKFRLLALTILLYLLPVAFILGWRAFEYVRYTMHVYPVFLCCGSVALFLPYRQREF